jgi:hypothetical protein
MAPVEMRSHAEHVGSTITYRVLSAPLPANATPPLTTHPTRKGPPPTKVAE